MFVLRAYEEAGLQGHFPRIHGTRALVLVDQVLFMC